jgi:hypothetical protein
VFFVLGCSAHNTSAPHADPGRDKAAAQPKNHKRSKAAAPPTKTKSKPLEKTKQTTVASSLPAVKLVDGTSLAAGKAFAKERMVCPKKRRPGTTGGCYCLAPYTCKGSTCSFDGELSFIRGKLRSKAWVPFVYAEYGSCDDHRYIYMDKGETLGTILVFYGPKGRKIALERTSDYNQFCHGRALHAFFGQLPGCRKMRRLGVISPNPKGKTPLSAYESLLRRSKP